MRILIGSAILCLLSGKTGRALGLVLMKRERVGPYLGAIGVEDERRVLRRSDPGSARNLVVELRRRPAGIAERDQALLRSLSAADIAQHLAGIAQRHAAVDLGGVRSAVVGAVQREGGIRADRTAKKNKHAVGHACGVGAEGG